MFRKNREHRGRGLILWAVLCLVLSGVMLGILYFQQENGKGGKRTETFSEIRNICELATLKCYYHNVATFEKKPDSLFASGLFQYGHKKMWFEYSGIVRIGVDFSQVRIDPVGADRVVRIHIPPAKVLSVTCDTDSFSEPLEETGVWTSITFDDRAAAFAEAQNTMTRAAEENTSLLLQARERTRQIVAEYIRSVGRQNGVEYTLEWIDD